MRTSTAENLKSNVRFKRSNTVTLVRNISMPKGKCKIAKQLGNKGMFVEIVVDVTVNKDEGVDIFFHKNAIEIYSPPEDLQIACKCGIYYAYEKLYRYISAGITVEVTDFRWFTIDTKVIPVMYASASAVWNAFDYDIDRTAIFDKTDFSFTFFKD